jgi:hypothetical protein
MLEMKEYSLKDIEEIYGKNKLYGYKGSKGKHIKGYLEKYPILENEDVYKWIINKIKKFKRKDKKGKNFNITSYLRALQDYCDYYKVSNPSDLLKENVDTRNQRVVDYLVHLINLEKRNPVSVKNAYQSRIKSFYSARGSPITDGLETEQNGLNKDEISLDKEKIQAILNRLNNSNYKLLAKIQSLLGFRISDAIEELTMSVKDSEGNLKPKYEIKKYKDHYLIKDFHAKKENVRIKNVFFPKELTNLIQAITNKDDLTKVDLSKDILKTRNNTLIRKSEYLRKLKKVASELYPDEVMRTHSFRKYFSTHCGYVNLSDLSKRLIGKNIGSEIEFNFKEHLIGHKTHYSSKVYNQILDDIEQFYSLWKPLENSISIDIETVNITDKEVLKLAEKNTRLEKRIDILINEKIELKDKIEEQENLTKNALEMVRGLTERLESLEQQNEKTLLKQETQITTIKDYSKRISNLEKKLKV